MPAEVAGPQPPPKMSPTVNSHDGGRTALSRQRVLAVTDQPEATRSTSSPIAAGTMLKWSLYGSSVNVVGERVELREHRPEIRSPHS